MNNFAAGWETDLAILRLSGASIEEFDDHTVVKSPQNPTFHWGNFVLVSDHSQVDNPNRWVSTFEKSFPGAGWVSIGLPTFPANPEAWESLGLELETMEVLKADELPPLPNIASPYHSRQFLASDWQLLLEREIASNIKSGEHNPDSFEPFIRKSIENYQKISQEGKAAWFGAFHHDELVADLGIVLCGEIARYQSVQTDENHRKQGLASNLLGMAAQWSGQMGCSSWVIVTETTNDAGRVYRRAGFKPDVETVTAYRHISTAT